MVERADVHLVELPLTLLGAYTAVSRDRITVREGAKARDAESVAARRRLRRRSGC